MSWKSISNSNYSVLLGDLHIKIENEKPIFKMKVLEKHLNSADYAHGGFLMSLLDNAMGNACFLAFGKNPCVTISMTTHFIKAASLGDELIVKPLVEKKTNTLCFVKSEILCKDEVLASGTGIWKLAKLNKTIKQKLTEDDGGW
tara:strand:- start:521 stop:952 length:432 start_codon:yes stop_codon:yes gene_type:complete